MMTEKRERVRKRPKEGKEEEKGKGQIIEILTVE
jgi:hypothetical protein